MHITLQGLNPSSFLHIAGIKADALWRETGILCLSAGDKHGLTAFPNGRLCYRAGKDPTVNQAQGPKTEKLEWQRELIAVVLSSAQQGSL